MVLHKKSISFGKIKLIVSTLGFTPELLISEHILKILTEESKLKLLIFAIIYPDQNPLPEQLINAMNTIKAKCNALKNMIPKLEYHFYKVTITRFDECVIQIIEIVGSYFENHFQPSEIELYFNLSGGMNILILAGQMAARYCPTKKIFTTIENTTTFRYLNIDNVVPRINETRYLILKTFTTNSESKNFDKITKEMVVKKRNRTTIYRIVKKMVQENLLTIDNYSPKDLTKYKPTLHGLCILKAIEQFPDIYYFHRKNHFNK
ncbi:MAG: hypothetical protein ACTSRS_09935 [Candidatus Helarchaeota archaeon]